MTDEAFIAAAERVTTLMNDEIIVTELAKMGFKIGDRVANVANSSGTSPLSGIGVVVGYQVFYGTKHVMVDFNQASACTRAEQNIHSSYHKTIPNQKIWALEARALSKETVLMKDIEIGARLQKCGLFIGQTVSLTGMYEGVTGTVVGASLTDDPVVRIDLAHRDRIFSHDLQSGELHSSYTTHDKYSLVSTDVIKGAKNPLDALKPAVKPSPWSPSISRALKDEKITQALAKEKLHIGQTVFWKNSLHSQREMLVIGHNGAHPVFAFNDHNGSKKDFSVKYMESPEQFLHSRFDSTKFPVFALNANNLETLAEHNAARSLKIAAKVKTDTADKKIVDDLHKFGLKLGDRVEYLAGPTGAPQSHPVTAILAGCVKNTGIVSGIVAGQPVIMPEKSFPEAWSEQQSEGSIHSSYASRGYKFWAVHYQYIRKAPTPAERQATAAARLAEITAKFAAKPFPEIAVEGLVIKKKNPIRADLKKAGYRIVAKQSLKLTHGMICNLLKNKGASNEKIEAIASVLSSEYGKAALSMAMGCGIAYLPMVADRAAIQGTKLEHLAILGEELRIGGMTIAGNELIETIFKSALEVLLTQETEKKIRVSSEDNSLLEEHLLEETSSTEDKKRSA